MNETLNKLRTIVLVLNNIETHGKNNLLNLGGAIDMIEETIKEISELAHLYEQETEN